MRPANRPALLALAFALAGVIALPVLAPASVPAVQLSAKLKGNAEVPGPGDPNGRGEAFVAAKPAKRKICFQVSWVKIQRPNAAHIHKGGKDVDGPIKVELFAGTPPSDIVEDCIRGLKRKLVRRIARRPESFYVNVHNPDYPDGAIRGQLEPAL
jgi:CHRD domain